MIDNYTKSLFSKYRRKGILIDTNLVLLWFIGSVNRDLISTFKHTKNFTTDDYDTLKIIINSFSIIATTPNILTEVSNLVNKGLAEDYRASCFIFFAQFVTQIQENYIESKKVTNTNQFIKLGLTDCGIENIATKNKYLVLTVDFPLYGYLSKNCVDVINFNSLRDI